MWHISLYEHCEKNSKLHKPWLCTPGAAVFAQEYGQHALWLQQQAQLWALHWVWWNHTWVLPLQPFHSRIRHSASWSLSIVQDRSDGATHHQRVDVIVVQVQQDLHHPNSTPPAFGTPLHCYYGEKHIYITARVESLNLQFPGIWELHQSSCKLSKILWASVNAQKWDRRGGIVQWKIQTSQRMHDSPFGLGTTNRELAQTRDIHKRPPWCSLQFRPRDYHRDSAWSASRHHLSSASPSKVSIISSVKWTCVNKLPPLFTFKLSTSLV